MNRIIKFRAWDTKENKMYYWDKEPYLSFMIGDYGDILANAFREANATDFMQFTGLVDKNEKEIYEGDIVKKYYHCLNYYGEEFKESIINKVEWGYYCDYEYVSHIECWLIGESSLSEEVFTYSNRKESLGKSTGYGKTVIYEEYIQVIGDIHQHPELLT